MLIELPIAVLKNSTNADAANAFVRFTKGEVAQELFGRYGWRPVNPGGREAVRREVPGAPRHRPESATGSSAAGAPPTASGST